MIIGAGGHGQAAYEIFSKSYKIFFVDDNPKLKRVLGAEVLGGTESLLQLRNSYSNVFVAIGDNVVREKLVKKVLGLGYNLVSAIHNTACVAATAKLGQGIMLGAGAVLGSSVILKDGVVVYPNVTIEHNTLVKEFTYFGPGANISGDNDIGRLSFIGTGATTIQNITIGHSVTVGAGAVVINNISDKATVVGIPAKPIRRRK